jgi:hypothetical protein
VINWRAEGGFGDKHIATDRLKGCAGDIGLHIVIAGYRYSRAVSAAMDESGAKRVVQLGLRPILNASNTTVHNLRAIVLSLSSDKAPRSQAHMDALNHACIKGC